MNADAWLDFSILANPLNWIVIALVTIFGAFALYVLWTNAGQLTPKL